MKALIPVIICLIALTSCEPVQLPVSQVIDRRQDFVGRYRVEYFIQNDGIKQGVSTGPSGVDTLVIVAADSINKVRFITRTDTFSVQLTDKFNVSALQKTTTFSINNRYSRQSGFPATLSGEGFIRNDTITYQRFYSVSEPTRNYKIYYFCGGPKL